MYNSNSLHIALGSIQRILVTGGAGFIGSQIVDELLNRGFKSFIIDNFSSGKLDNLKHNLSNPLLHILRGDISQIHDILKDLKDLDVVFHEAAIASVTESVSNPENVFDSNVASTMKVIDFCVNYGVKKIIFASSSAVYGDLPNDVLREDLACKPISPYGASKLSVENYLHGYWKTYGLKCVSLVPDLGFCKYQKHSISQYALYGSLTTLWVIFLISEPEFLPQY